MGKVSKLLSKAPHAALAVVAVGMIALLVWSLWPRPALVDQDILRKPFEHAGAGQ